MCLGGTGVVPQICNLRNSLSFSQLRPRALPHERGLQGLPHKHPHSEPSGFWEVEGRLSGSREGHFSLFRDWGSSPVALLTNTLWPEVGSMRRMISQVTGLGLWV